MSTAMKTWILNLLFLGGSLAVASWLTGRLIHPPEFGEPRTSGAAVSDSAGFQQTVHRVEEAWQTEWHSAGVVPVGPASDLTVARRLALALTGTVPSLEEIRALEKHHGNEAVQWWLSHLFEDRRSSDYLAERFARVLVGIEDGPFVLYRRHRLVSWLSDRIQVNQPYDALVREIITAQGIWTSRPEVNFVTVTVDPNNQDEGPDEQKLAGRVTRAFLGVRLDCVQCHDDKLGGSWKQSDFHQLASFFAGTELSLAGIRDNPAHTYGYRYLGKTDKQPVPARVPFNEELLPDNGSLRERLAIWVTHPENRAFARTLVNRTWAILFNRPMIKPVDSIPLSGPLPTSMEILVDDFTEHRFDLQRLVRIIASTRLFQMESRSPDLQNPVSSQQELQFASFPLTRLRPEQIASSLLQSASLKTIDAESHVLRRIQRFFQQNDFIKRYGDIGKDEFDEFGGTIPQRLLLMNGGLIHERTREDLFLNAATRIGALAPNEASAVDAAYLVTLTRRPTPEERSYFITRWKQSPRVKRSEQMEDLFWTLINSTEFSWNH